MNPEPLPATAGDTSSEAPTEAPAATPEPAAAALPEASAEALLSAPKVEVAAPAAEAAPTAPELSPAATGVRLAELFPALFTAAGAPGPAKPIKLRIHADIQARAPGVFTKRVLGIFFSRYTTTNAYLKALATAPQRFDLDGQPAGEISDEHRQLATEELVRRHALAAERRAAQRPQPRREGPAGEMNVIDGEPREARPEQRRPDVRPGGPPPARPRRSSPSPRPDHDRPRAGRDGGAPPSRDGPRPPRHPTRPTQAPRAETPSQDAALPPLPMDPAQRERALLLRSFESSPLSKANFCALKGISEAALDAALAQALAERGTPAKGAAASKGVGR